MRSYGRQGQKRRGTAECGPSQGMRSEPGNEVTTTFTGLKGPGDSSLEAQGRELRSSCKCSGEEQCELWPTVHTSGLLLGPVEGGWQCCSDSTGSALVTSVDREAFRTAGVSSYSS